MVDEQELKSRRKKKEKQSSNGEFRIHKEEKKKRKKAGVMMHRMITIERVTVVGKGEMDYESVFER